MSDRIFVVSGTYQQYTNYVKDRLAQQRPEDSGINSTDFKYVMNADTLKGLHPVHGVYIGTWESRGDIEDIKLQIRVANW